MVVALLGGILIGAGATLLWFANRRVAGVAGLLHDALRGRGTARAVSVAFVLGLLAAGAVLGRHTTAEAATGAPGILVAGLLVGFGARLGGGCTSGHGVCGISRLSVRSIAATVIFMLAAIVTVAVTRHV